MASATIIYACNQQGLLIFTKPGTLTEWLPPRMVLQGQHLTSVWAEPGPPTKVLAVSNAELIASENGGRTWQKAEPFGSEHATVPINIILQPGEPPTLYVSAIDGSLTSSQDGGVTWTPLSALPPGRIIQLLPLTNDPTLVYALLDHCGETTLLQGNPAGDWRTLPLSGANTVAQDKASGNIYAATLGGVQVSTDNGASWASIPGSTQDAHTMLVLPGPAGKPSTIIAGTQASLSLSHDKGVTWSGVDLPVGGSITTLTHDPERRDRLYAATTEGYLLESGDRAQTWKLINSTPTPTISYLYVIRI